MPCRRTNTTCPRATHLNPMILPWCPNHMPVIGHRANLPVKVIDCAMHLHGVGRWWVWCIQVSFEGPAVPGSSCSSSCRQYRARQGRWGGWSPGSGGSLRAGKPASPGPCVRCPCPGKTPPAGHGSHISNLKRVLYSCPGLQGARRH